MNNIVAEHMEEIRKACEEFRVIRLELFGSAATDAFDPATSDFDFIVEWAPGQSLGPWMTLYFEFQERLEQILGRSVDLVEAGAPRNPYFIKSMNESRRLLYAA